MTLSNYQQTGIIKESIRGIVDQVTYHYPDNGWSVLHVLPFNNPHQQETVVVHQTKVFAGANVAMGKDHTLFAKVGGKVVFKQGLKRRTYVSVMPVPEAAE